MDKKELAEIGRRAAEAAVAAATAGAAAARDKDLATAAVVTCERGGSTSEFKLSAAVIAAIVALAAAFGWQMTHAEQLELVKAVAASAGGLTAVFATVRTWRKNAA